MNQSIKRLPYHDASQVAGVSHKDRLITAAFFVLLLHGVAILGITFSSGDAPPNGPTFAVTLVQSRSAEAPDHADYIAQANQVGRGGTDARARPTSPVSSPAQARRDGKLDGRDETHRAAPAVTSAADRIVTTRGDARHAYAGEYAQARANASPRLLIARLMTPLAAAADPTRSRKARAPGDNPRDRTISVNTEESRFASYLDAWRKQVTRIGNLNYPQAIRANHMSGRLTLEVALDADGSIHKLTLVKPAKHAELNAAALTIVRSGAPYPPFPKTIRKDTDVLRFVYEWRFVDGQLAGG
ncbi:MAG TPA: energy transducer TonB [Gammaproteobacteria bacterium]|nr:energy transducer TonB [Gammaproteobacteria bacterium]